MANLLVELFCGIMELLVVGRSNQKSMIQKEATPNLKAISQIVFEILHYIFLQTRPIVTDCKKWHFQTPVDQKLLKFCA